MIVCTKCGQQNEDGATFCARCSAFLEWTGEQVDAGPAPGPVTPQAGIPERRAQPGPAPAAPSRAVATTLSAAVQPVDPGNQVVFTLEVRNLGQTIDRLTIEVLGDAAAWAEVDPPTLNLMPGTSGTATVRFRPPRSSGVRAGDINFGIGIRSAEHPESSVVERGVIRISAYTDLEIELVPRARRGRRGATFTIRAANQGNVPVSLALAGTDPEGLLGFRFTPSTLAVEPGATGLATVAVSAGDTFLAGSRRSRPFQVIATPSNQPRRTLEGSLLQTALLPAWVPAAIGIGVAALAFMVLANPFGGGSVASPSPTAAPASAAPSAAAPSEAAPGTEAPVASAAPSDEAPASTEPTPAEAAIGPLVFDSSRGSGYRSIYRLQDGVVTPLAGTEADAMDATCYRNQVFYTGWGQLGSDIWAGSFDADAAPPVNLTSTADVNEQNPSYSPPRDEVLYDAFTEGNQDIYRMSLKGMAVSRLTEGPSADGPASWSPDGNWIAFVSNWDRPEQEATDLYLIDADTGEVNWLTNDGSVAVGSPAWSPDGSQIAYRSDSGGQGDIYVIDIYGSARYNLTNSPAQDWAPSWSPDGRLIAFQSDRDGNWEIYVVGPDGSGLRNLTDNPAEDGDPSWCTP